MKGIHFKSMNLSLFVFVFFLFTSCGLGGVGYYDQDHIYDRHSQHVVINGHDTPGMGAVQTIFDQAKKLGITLTIKQQKVSVDQFASMQYFIDNFDLDSLYSLFKSKGASKETLDILNLAKQAKTKMNMFLHNPSFKKSVLADLKPKHSYFWEDKQGNKHFFMLQPDFTAENNHYDYTFLSPYWYGQVFHNGLVSRYTLGQLDESSQGYFTTKNENLNIEHIILIKDMGVYNPYAVVLAAGKGALQLSQPYGLAYLLHGSYSPDVVPPAVYSANYLMNHISIVNNCVSYSAGLGKNGQGSTIECFVHQGVSIPALDKQEPNPNIGFRSPIAIYLIPKQFSPQNAIHLYSIPTQGIPSQPLLDTLAFIQSIHNNFQLYQISCIFFLMTQGYAPIGGFGTTAGMARQGKSFSGSRSSYFQTVLSPVGTEDVEKEIFNYHPSQGGYESFQGYNSSLTNAVGGIHYDQFQILPGIFLTGDYAADATNIYSFAYGTHPIQIQYHLLNGQTKTVNLDLGGLHLHNNVPSGGYFNFTNIDASQIEKYSYNEMLGGNLIHILPTDS